MMKKMNLRVSLLCLAMAAPVFCERKINLFTAFDIGRVENGYDLQYQSNMDGTVLNRTYVDVGITDQLSEFYQINIGLGGIFWKSVAFGGADGADEKVIKFGPGISSAYMRWTPIPSLALDFGYFPYKYNESAKNLGEYLFRSEAYPTIIHTGGWSWMNDVQYHTVGVKLSWNMADGKFKQDIGLFGEYFNSPIYDISPAYIATWKPIPGLTIGGAGSLHRFITPTRGVRKELTKSFAFYEDFYFPAIQTKARLYIDVPGGGYFVTYDQEYAFGGTGSTSGIDSARARFWLNDSVSLGALGFNQSTIPVGTDSIVRAGRNSFVDSRLRDDVLQDMQDQGSDSATYFGNPANALQLFDRPDSISFDLRAIKLVAYFELNFNRLLGLKDEKMGAFNLYGEVAQLGLKNYPIFYTDAAQRRPIMIGFSVPTMGLLQHLSFEMEYLKNPNIESIASTFDKLELLPDQAFRYQKFKRDDYKWTLHAGKNITKEISIYVQVANDHMRMKDKYARPEFIPVTSTPENWYWLTRIQWYL